MKIRLTLFVCSSALVFSGCSPAKPTEFDAEAVRQLLEMKQAGALPGFAKDDQGSGLEFENGLVPSGTIVFPLGITMKAVKLGDNFLYHFSLLKESAAKPWKLTKAWKTDPAGRVTSLTGQ